MHRCGGGRALAGIHIDPPALVRFFKDRDGEIRVHVHNSRGTARRIRVGMVAPEGIEAVSEDVIVNLPEGAETAEFVWRCTPRRRGRYRVDACYLEASSPLGFWAVRRAQA